MQELFCCHILAVFWQCTMYTSCGLIAYMTRTPIILLLYTSCALTSDATHQVAVMDSLRILQKTYSVKSEREHVFCVKRCT